MRRNVLLILVSGLLVIAGVFIHAAVQPTYSERDFATAFGTSPRDSTTAQWMVDYTILTLTDASCECAKQYQVFPTDNYSLETITHANFRRLERSVAIAQQFGFAIPERYEQFRNHEQWEPGTPYDELDCYN